MAGEEQKAGKNVSTVGVHISDDQLTCTIDIPAALPSQPRILLGNLIKALLDAGVERSRIDDDTLADGLRRARETKTAQTDVAAAQGIAPTPASGWRVQALGQLTNHCVMPGVRIAEIVADEPASDGITVTGEVLPSPPAPKQPRLTANSNVVLSPKGDYAVAQIYGEARVEGFMVLVEPGLEISRNLQTCRMNCFPAHSDGHAVSTKDLKQLIDAAGIQPQFVLKEALLSTIEQLWNQPTPIPGVLVAKGQPPVQAIDGHIDLSVTDPNTAVFPGAWVARRIPSSAAAEGMNLVGEVIPVDNTVQEAEMELGEGVRYDPEDDDLLVATRYGAPSLEGCRVSMSEALRIDPAGKTVHLDVYPRKSGDQPIEFKDLYQLVLSEGIAEETLHPEPLRLALADTKKNQTPLLDVQVASAQEPYAGSGGQVIIQPSQGTLICAGDQIGRIESELPPQPGTDVLGQSLEAPAPLPPPLHAGVGVQFDEEKRALYALSTGLLRIEGELIELQPVVEVSDDRLEAWLNLPLYKIDGQEASADETTAVVIEAGIHEPLILQEALVQALQSATDPSEGTRTCIARGKPPIKGVPTAPLPASHLNTGCLLPGDIALSPGAGATSEAGISVIGETLAAHESSAAIELMCDGLGIVDESGAILAQTYGFAQLDQNTIKIESGIQISEDGLRCLMDVHHRRANGMELETDDLVEALVECGIVRERIDSESISQALERSIEQDAPALGVLVASGVPPRPSEDWSIKAPDEAFSRCVMPEDTVAWRQASMHAKSGVGVRGEKILAPATQNRPKLKAGRNCEVEPRGNFITSNVYGRIVVDNKRFSVLPGLRIAEDRISARMDLFEKRVDGRVVSAQEISNLLQAQGIQSEFILPETIEHALKTSNDTDQGVENVLVAMAKPPDPGRDGRIEPMADPMLGCVMPGEVAARTVEPTAPTNGTDLFGNALLATGETEPVILVAGEHCRTDGDQAVAEKYGQVRIEGGEVRIRPGIRADEAGRKLEIDVFPQRVGGSPTTLSDLLKLLTETGVKQDHIDTPGLESALKEALALNRPLPQFVVARTLEPDPGKPGHVELIGNVGECCALPGDSIAHLLGFEPPQPGQSFTGEPIESPPTSLAPLLAAGEFAAIDEEGLLATALIYGVPVLDGRTVDVKPGIRISDDQLTCEMDLLPRRVTGESLTLSAVVESLTSLGVQAACIDQEALKYTLHALKSRATPFKQVLVVAKGVPAVPADPGFPVAIGDLENGCVFAGDLIAEFTQNQEESQGISVTGEPLLPRPIDDEGRFLVHGPADLEENGRRVRAREYGFATLHGREVHVQSAVHISADGMRCLVDISPSRADGVPLSAEDLLRALRNAGLAEDLIDREAIERGRLRAAKTGEVQLGVEVARGRTAIQAEDWRIETVGDLEQAVAIPGDAILRRIPDRAAKAGLTVRGERVSAPTSKERPRLKAGLGAKRSPKGGSVFATLYGVPVVEGDTCHIEPGIRVSEDELTCEMDLFPMRTNRVSMGLRDLITALEDFGVQPEFILREELDDSLRTVLQTGKPTMGITAARGRPLFEGQSSCPSLTTEEPNRCAMPGDIVARLQKALPPTPGMTVFGQEIKIDVEPAEGLVETGEFTRFSEEDDGAVVALIMGRPHLEGTRVDIQPAIEIAESGRVCHMNVYPYKLDGTPLNDSDLIHALTNEKILESRIDTEGLSLARRQAQDEEALVAHALVALGTDPFPASPGRLEVMERAQGVCAFPGDVLARIVDVEEAESGISVTGEKIFSEEEALELRLEIGEGCELSRENLNITATEYGRIKHLGIALSVKPALVVEDNGEIARMDILPTRVGNREVGFEELLEVIKSKGILEHLVDTVAIRHALKIAKETPQVGVVVARCRLPIEGTTGTILTVGELAGRALFPGDLILRIEGALDPEDGISVTGSPVPPSNPTEAIKLSANSFCTIDETLQTITAQAYGTATVKESSVEFTPGIKISADGLQAHMDIFAQRSTGEMLTQEDLKQALSSAGILEEAICQEALSNGLKEASRQGTTQQVLVAAGTPAKDARTWSIQTIGELQDRCVLPGDQVLRRHLVGEISPGLTVTGETLPPPPPGRSPVLISGDGCRPAEASGILEASVYGEAVRAGHAVRVRPGIRVSASEIECHMDIFPQRSSGTPVSLELLKALLKQEGIQPEFIDTNLIHETILLAQETQTMQRNVLVAVALLPSIGTDGRLSICTDDTCAAVFPGDPVARLLAPIEPTEGTNLKGKPLPTTNQTVLGTIEGGEFTRYNDKDNSQLDATVYGQPIVDGHRGHVRPGIQVDPAGLECKIDVFPRRTNGDPMTIEMLHKFLSDAGISPARVQGDVLQDALTKSLETNLPVRGVKAAQATEAEAGSVGHIEFTGRNAYGVVLAGDIVATRMGVVQPRGGLNVMGEELPPPDMLESPTHFVEGCDIDEETGNFLALEYGSIQREGSQLKVVPGIRVSADGLTCEMDIHGVRGDGSTIRVSDLVSQLQQQGISPETIDEVVISVTLETSLHTNSLQNDVVVASGKPGIAPGLGEFKPTGTLDMTVVLPGDILLKREPAFPGEEGFTVTGEPLSIPTNPIERSWSIEGTCEFSEDGNSVLANRYGFALISDSTLHVEPGIHILDDGARCTMDFATNHCLGRKLQMQDFVNALVHSGIAPSCIDQKTIKRALDDISETEETLLGLVVAMGTQPVSSEGWSQTATGEFHNGCAFPGDVVLKIVANQPAKAGMKVTGERILAPKTSRPPKLYAGPGCSIAGHGLVAFAMEYGQVCVQGNTVEIEPGVRFSDDGLICRLDVFPFHFSGRAITEPALIDALVKAEVPMESVDLEVLRAAITRSWKTGHAERDLLIAKGLFPEPHQDGRIEPTAEPGITGFFADEPLASLLDPVEGRAGLTLSGEEIPIEGETKTIQMEVGEYCKVDESGRAIAEVYGRLVVEGETVTMLPGLMFDELGFECHIDLFPFRLGGKPTTIKDIISLLTTNGVPPDRINTPILEVALEQAQKSNRPALDVVAALPMSPMPGEPGEVRPIGDPRKTIAFTGDLVARLEGRTDPNPGLNVMGDEVSPPMDAYPPGLDAGEHCSLSGDGMLVTAEHYGHVVIDGLSVTISPGIRIIKDGMECRIDITGSRPDGTTIQIDDLLNALRSQGIDEDCIDKTELELALQAATSGLNPDQRNVCAARGILPQAGKVGRLETTHPLQHGCLVPGDIFLQLSGAEPAINGKTVTGEPIVPESDPAQPAFEVGEHCERSSDGFQVVATTYGRGVFENGTASVVQGFRISEDKMRCLVEIVATKTNGDLLKPEELIQALVADGIDPNAINHDRIVESLSECGDGPVRAWAAQGTPSIPGSHARLEALSALETGSVTPGEIFAQLITPVLGRPGTNVLGDIIDPKQRLRALEFDKPKNCQVLQEDMHVSSQTYGGVFVTVSDTNEHPEGPIRITRKLAITVKPGLRIPKDKMTCEMDIYPCLASGPPTTIEGILKTLDDSDIDPRAIDREAILGAISEAQETGSRVEGVLVAHAVPPVHGEPGQLRFINSEGPGNHPKGQLEPIHVSKGEHVLIVAPPTMGQPGHTVTGTPIPAQDGKPASLVVGSGIKMRGHTASANRDGVLLFRKDLIDVVGLTVLDSHLENPYRVSAGSIEIRGTVLPGCRLTVPGDAYIHGDINDADITAGGSIYTQGHVAGSATETTTLRAGGAIEVNSAEDAVLIAGGDISIHETATHSRIQSGGYLWMTSSPGALVGGETHATKGAILRELGHKDQTPTILEVGGEDRTIAQLRMELEQARIALEFPDNPSADTTHLADLCDELERKLALATEAEQQRIPGLVMTGAGCHPAATISIDGATHGVSSEPLGPGYFYVEPIEYSVVFTPLHELGEHSSLEEFHVKASKHVQQLRRKASEAAILKAANLEKSKEDSNEGEEPGASEP